MRKKILKWIFFVLFTPVVLFFILAGLLYIPSIQDFAVKKSTEYISKATNMEVSLEKFRLAFLFDIDLRNLILKDSENDILLDMERLVIDLDFTSMLRGEIQVEDIEIEGADVDTKSLISGVGIKGHLGFFSLDSHGIKLPQEMVIVNNAQLEDSNIEIALEDTTTVEDTTSSAVKWRIALGKVAVSNTGVKFRMPGDSMTIDASLNDVSLKGGYIDLGKQIYKLRTFSFKSDSLRYDLPYEEPVEGLDVNHIALSDVDLRIDSIRFEGASMYLSLAMQNLSAKEKSGINISDFKGNVIMTSSGIMSPGLLLKTSYSYINLIADTDFSAFSPDASGNMDISLVGQIGKNDVMLFAGDMGKEVVNSYPDAPVNLQLLASGNMKSMKIDKADVSLKNTFSLKAGGELRNIADSVKMEGNVDMQMLTSNLSFVEKMVDVSGGFRIPRLRINGKLALKGSNYDARLRIHEGRRGSVSIKAAYDTKKELYSANLSVDSVNVHHFLPKDSIYHISMNAVAEGRGTDIFSKFTRSDIMLKLKHLDYAGLGINNVQLDASLHRGTATVNFISDNPLLEMDAEVAANISKKNSVMSFTTNLKKADFYALRLVDKPFKTAMNMHIDGSSDLKKNHKLSGQITDIALIPEDTVFHPKDIYLDLTAMQDTTAAYVKAGDFKLSMSGDNGYETLLKEAQGFMAELDRQLKNRHLNQDSLKMFLPNITVDIISGKDNPIYNYILTQGYSFKEMRFRLNSDSAIGLNGGGYMYSMQTGGIVLDTIQMHIYQDSTGVKMDGRLRNGPKNQQFVFDARANAYLHNRGAGIDLLYLDKKGKKGLDFGVRADVVENGIRMVLSNTKPIIAYRTFSINDDNYVYLANDRHLKADIELVADDGTAASVHTTDNPEALQDVSLSLNNWNLGELTSIIPYAPYITGMLNADAHLIQTEENFSIMSDLSVNDMAFEGSPLGNIGLNAVYLPNEDGTHVVDAILSRNEENIMTMNGVYTVGDMDDNIEADIDITHLPMSMANGFMPQNLLELDGFLDGDLNVKGTPNSPVVGGWVALENMRVKSPEYSLNMRIENDTILLAGSKLDFDNLRLYSTGANPLTFDGKVDFSDTEDIRLDLSMNSRNFELINAGKTQQASAYGKVNVDVNTAIKGNLNYINVTGRLNVLGSTDVTYVLKDSPLTVEDRLSDLVTFVNFNDTVPQKPVEKPRPTNINLIMQVGIDQAAQVHCLLSADRSSYIDIEGGGELTMVYTPLGELRMNGRYTVLSGEMKYSLPVIPLKTFNIKSGSYIDFNGNVMNPTLNIAATERVRTTVTENNSPRTVTFDVGLAITQNLENMGLEFTLQAPEDMTIQNQLASMSKEQRGRLAVTMLATGMYLANENMESFSTQNALNAFLQNEISSIAGKTLESIDLSLGMENETQSDGSTRTDYSFRFAKRFWGNRVSVIIGGKVSTGEDVENTGETLIDNVALEYRLDQSATRYVTLYYDKSYESLLEGEITEMGAGIVLRRKMTRLGELFIFGNRRNSRQEKTNDKDNEDDK